MLPCKRCNGEKHIISKGFTSVEGEVYPDKKYPCSSCNGQGYLPEVNTQDILNRILATKGKSKGKLRASMISPLSKDGIEAIRAYYVWRIARFHGGKDMTMPMMADLMSRGDPYKEELDKLADKVAEQYLGTNKAAAFRWGKALGII